MDRTLQQQDSGVESALLYAKAWSKYTKELLAWVEKRLSIGQTQQEWQIVRLAHHKVVIKIVRVC